MPKKPSTVLVMQDYPPLSSRRWFKARVQRVQCPNRTVRLEISIDNNPGKAGRVVVHEVPAILAPNSPLCLFLSNGFGVEVAENASFDLATLIGRAVEVRFAKAQGGQAQAIVAIRRCDETPTSPAPMPVGRQAEAGRGLG